MAIHKFRRLNRLEIYGEKLQNQESRVSTEASTDRADDVTTSLETRIAVLESELRAADEELRELKAMMQSHAASQITNHAENSLRLAAIENALLEMKVYFKLGRWIMAGIWAIGGAAATASLVKWFGLAKL